MFNSYVKLPEGNQPKRQPSDVRQLSHQSAIPWKPYRPEVGKNGTEANASAVVQARTA